MASFDIDLHDSNASSVFDNNNAKVSDVKISRTRSISENLVPRSDFSIIEFDKLKPIKISLQGTVAGSNWNSTRQHWTNLKNTLNAGNLKFYLDSERFVDCIAGNYSEEWMGISDFMKFAISLTGKNPYFQAVATTTFTTIPNPGTNFNISNAGQVSVGLRMVISSATSAHNNNLTLQNLSNSNIFSYVGSLAIGTLLEVDKGVQTYQTYRVQTGVADVFSDFQGDLISIEPGTNIMVFTGPKGTSINFSHREHYA